MLKLKDYDKREATHINGIKYEIQSYHPTGFEKGIFAVRFYPKNRKYHVDKYIHSTAVKAKNRIDAIEKAKKELFYLKEFKIKI